MYESIRRWRRAVFVTAVAVIAGIVALVTVGWSNDGGHGWLAAIALTVGLVLPAAYALVSLVRRPSLLPAAVMAAVIAGMLTLQTLPLWFAAAILWGLAVRRRVRPAPEPTWAPIARPLLAAAIALPLLVMFSHADPVCTTTLADGSVVEVDPVSRGLHDGWRIGISGVGVSQSRSESGAVAEYCVSDSVQWWEATLSLVLTVSITAAVLRWPPGEALVPSRATQLTGVGS